MPKSTFQDIILKLQNYWAGHGCLIWQPYYTQVGAGTMNPATFLRVLGPEPWSVAYVEPSVRPDDGRYGQNPNRFQVHYQYQVILKPDPGDPQELYLDSLKALGIDPRQHDIRFVEDNWEQPAISAWGLGWEVWLDGQEITQFTYFQQVGGQALDPVAVELTYGLERILIALNNADAIWDEAWAPGVTYGEVRRQEEFEHSRYYFEVADVEAMRQVFERYERECQACLEQGLVLPAHDYVLKCSHTFNILDTRGAIGVTERQGYFRRMRELARQVAEAYLKQRQELEYPLLKTGGAGGGTDVETRITLPAALRDHASLLLEIGTEELPHGDVQDALAQLRERVPAWLDELRLEHGAVRVEGTPRRLAVYVQALAPAQPDREQVVKGPPADRAFDPAGVALPAAVGFAKKNGVDTRDLEVREIDGGQYAVALVRSQGRPAAEVLAQALPGLVAGIGFTKSMRWNHTGVAFSRPVRWLVALLGEGTLPFEYAGVTAGRRTRGLRPYDSPEIEISSADAYFPALQQAGVVLAGGERQARIMEQVRAEAASVKGEAILDPDLLAEVTDLVEKPTAVLGSFNQEYLELPREVLIAVMKKHQRYFPVQKKTALLPYFIAIRNGDDRHLDFVRQGNEHVLNARFADADFFVREDLKQPLEAYRPALAKLVYQTRLGSMLDKSDRMLKLVEAFVDWIGLGPDEAALARRAAFLAKADLATQMVTEMTSLQGLIGREYALRSGEPEGVADAIGEQYRAVPQTRAGLAVALAERMDALAGLFAAGLAPTGAKDPFALRRAAIGVVQSLIEHDLHLDLRAVVARAAGLQPVEAGESVQAQVLEFLAGRLSVLLKESFRYDVVDAVLAVRAENPAGAARAVRQLGRWVERKDWDAILAGYARCARIVRAAQEGDRIPGAVDENKLVDPAEKALAAALRGAGDEPPATVDEFLSRVLGLLPAINTFFDQVLVMDEDSALRKNRLALVQEVAALAEGIADLSKLEGF